MRHSLPMDYPSNRCILIPVDVLLAPILVSQLLPLLQSRLWTVEGYQAGYEAIAGVLAQMTSMCAADLVQEIRDFRGVKASSSSIPLEDRTSADYNSLNELLAANLATRGVLSDGWFTDELATLTDVVQAVRGTDKTNTVGLWGDVATLLTEGGDIASIIGVITGALTQEEETVVEGGLLTALIAITAANSGLLQALSVTQALQYTTLQSLETKLEAILEALRGTTAPTDNILLALRGTTNADGTRNIITELE